MIKFLNNLNKSVVWYGPIMPKIPFEIKYQTFVAISMNISFPNWKIQEIFEIVFRILLKVWYSKKRVIHFNKSRDK